MPKNDVSSWDTAAANNTDVGGVDLAENSMRPRDVNNAIRTMMAQIKAGVPYLSTTFVFTAAPTPSANDGAALGVSGTAWSDLFLASGGVINWNAGNVTLTHSAGALALAANGFSVTSATAFQPQLPIRNNTNDANSAYVMVRKSRGVSDTAVQVSDTLGTFMFQGYDSTGTPVLRNGAYITAIVESVSSGAMAARFELTAGSSIWQFKTDNTMVLPTATLGTAAAATVEFDGKAFYTNAVASSRQVVTAQQFASNQSGDLTLNADANTQAYLNAANDTLTVQASTSYFFETDILLTTGTTSHTIAFDFGGTATFTEVSYHAISSIALENATSAAGSFAWVTQATTTVLTAAITAAAAQVRLRGIIRINGAGTIIPRIKFSANPTGTNLSKKGSYFRCWAIGSNTVAAVGNWA
jgi:hypothetical protein